MGNTELRGKVIWFLLTCRPDLLPVDLKRQGRAEEHIALFYPETDEERLAMLRAMQKKTGTHVASADVEKLSLTHAGALSGADIEAVLVRARMKSALEDDAAVDVDDLKSALEISSRRPTRPRSSCRTWRPCSSAPRGACCPTSTATSTKAKSSAGSANSRATPRNLGTFSCSGGSGGYRITPELRPRGKAGRLTIKRISPLIRKSGTCLRQVVPSLIGSQFLANRLRRRHQLIESCTFPQVIVGPEFQGLFPVVGQRGSTENDHLNIA